MPYLPIMADDPKDKAQREFRRMINWILLLGVLMALAAIAYLALTGELFLHMVIATLGGVFFSVVLGCGLMAATFFSDKSGHDRAVTDATRSPPPGGSAARAPAGSRSVRDP